MEHELVSVHEQFVQQLAAQISWTDNDAILDNIGVCPVLGARTDPNAGANRKQQSLRLTHTMRGISSLKRSMTKCEWKKVERFVATFREQQLDAAELDTAPAVNLKEVGYGG